MVEIRFGQQQAFVDAQTGAPEDGDETAKAPIAHCRFAPVDRISEPGRRLAVDRSPFVEISAAWERSATACCAAEVSQDRWDRARDAG